MAELRFYGAPMPNLPDVVLLSIPAFVLLTVIEVVSVRIHPDDDAAGYETKDAATSVGMGLGSLVFDFLWKIPIVAIYAAIHEVTPLRVPVLWWTVPLMLLGQDFFYYWSHRGHHVVRVLWACHVVHHSSRKFNLTTALRQPWTTWTVWPFYVPLIALGVHPAALAFCSSANLVYQFWIHTERIDKMPRWFEFVFNTPSHHRVHHASQGGYLDRNFGGILIVWDRLFGSFVLGDRAARLRAHQEHRHVQPPARGHPRVRRHRQGPEGGGRLARAGGTSLSRARLAADAEVRGVRAGHGARHVSPRHARVLLVSFGVAAAVDLVSLAAGFTPGHLVAKPLLMPLLAAHTVVRGGPRLLVAALLCGWGGDVLLLSDADPAFLVGMASFAAGHVCYLLLFRRFFRRPDSPHRPPHVRGPSTWLGGAYVLALVVTVTLLWPDLPAGLRVPVAGYSLLLTAMAAASTRLGPVAGAGGALFLLSDTLIATGVADWPQLPRPDFWIMLTYAVAQFLLVSGVLGTLGARSAARAAYGEMRSTTP